MTTRFIAPALALAALASSQTALAQQQACVAPADLSDAVVYAMPIAYDAARTACSNRLARDGFMATRGEAYIEAFRAEQNEAWPGAFRFLKSFMEKDGGEGGSSPDMGAMLGSMPEEALRPFVDALVGQMIAAEIKGDTCGKIERGIELLSPLPTDNIGGLIAFLFELTDMKNPQICAATPATTGTARK
jgi:hypothetical protein